MAKLPPSRKAKLRQKARQKAILDDAATGGPTVADLQGEKKGLQEDLASYAPAISMAKAAAQGTSTKGLKGPYARDLRKEIQGRVGSLNRAEPFLTADVRSDIAELNTDIATERRVLDANTEQNFQAMREDAIEKQSEARKEIKLALGEGRRLLAQIPPEDQPALREKETWVRLASQISKTEGVGLIAARQAVKQLQRALLLNEQGRIAAGPKRPPQRK